jgi:DNA-binding transcriptional MerR regulator
MEHESVHYHVSVQPDCSMDTPPSAAQFFSIGEVAREFGVSLRTLRFYEDRDLLHPVRQGTKRLYTDLDRSALQMILKGKQLGFTLSGIRAILAARGEATKHADLELSLNPEQIMSQIRQLERQREDLDHALQALRAAAEKVGVATQA